MSADKLNNATALAKFVEVGGLEQIERIDAGPVSLNTNSDDYNSEWLAFDSDI
jgi:hypothetical protein